MIRANLIPHAKVEKRQGLFGIDIDGANIFRGLAAAGFCAIVLVTVNGAMDAQLNDKKGELLASQGQLQALINETNNAGLLSSNVHRLQEIDRDAEWLRKSGQWVALRLAYIGNAVPANVSISHMEQNKDGWVINGDASTLGDVATEGRNFSGISPGLNTTIDSITKAGTALSYKVEILSPPPAPSPTPHAETNADVIRGINGATP